MENATITSSVQNILSLRANNLFYNAECLALNTSMLLPAPVCTHQQSCEIFVAILVVVILFILPYDLIHSLYLKKQWRNKATTEKNNNKQWRVSNKNLLVVALFCGQNLRNKTLAHLPPLYYTKAELSGLIPIIIVVFMCAFFCTVCVCLWQSRVRCECMLTDPQKLSYFFSFFIFFLLYSICH